MIEHRCVFKWVLNDGTVQRLRREASRYRPGLLKWVLRNLGFRFKNN